MIRHDIAAWRRAAPMTILVLAVWGAMQSSALADPCKAIPDKGPAPAWLRPGAALSGPVVYVGDGDSLCVDVGSRATGATSREERWVEVRLADFYAPELDAPEGPAAKASLERLVKGRRVDCVAGRRSYDRIVARCSVNGAAVGDRLRAAGVHEGGRGRSGGSM